MASAACISTIIGMVHTICARLDTLLVLLLGQKTRGKVAKTRLSQRLIGILFIQSPLVRVDRVVNFAPLERCISILLVLLFTRQLFPEGEGTLAIHPRTLTMAG